MNNIKIEFENGSVIKGIETDVETIRSNRVEESITYWENPYEFIKYYMDESFNQLKLWQKIYLKILCKVNNKI